MDNNKIMEFAEHFYNKHVNCNGAEIYSTLQSSGNSFDLQQCVGGFECYIKNQENKNNSSFSRNKLYLDDFIAHVTNNAMEGMDLLHGISINIVADSRINTRVIYWWR